MRRINIEAIRSNKYFLYIFFSWTLLKKNEFMFLALNCIM